jgi:hypothetical protein
MRRTPRRFFHLRDNDVPGFMRDVQRRFNEPELPPDFFGFNASRDTNGSPIPAVSEGVIALTGDSDEWASLVVPPGGAGTYVFDAGVYIGALARANWLISIAVNGTSIASSAFQASDDRRYVHGMATVSERDVIRLRLLNTTASSITPTVLAANANNPALPYLRATRVSL